MNKFIEAINDMVEIITGEKPKQKVMRDKGFSEEHTQQWLDWANEPKRARGKKGRYLADDPTTKGVNEAWVGGKEQQTKIDNRDNLMKKMLSNRYEDLMNE